MERKKIKKLDDKTAIVMNHATVPIRVISKDKIVDKINEIISSLNRIIWKKTK